jgi:hypothetical protein
MEFILEQQAAASVKLVEITARQEAMATMQEEMTVWQVKTDKRLNAIAKLLQAGMKMLARTDERLSELAAAQKQTELTLNRFIASLQRGANGRKR